MSTPESVEPAQPVAPEAEPEQEPGDELDVPAVANGQLESQPEPSLQPVAATEPDEDPVVAALSRIEAQLAESQRLLDRQVAIATKLHAENQILRAGELRKAQTATVLSVLRVFDDVNQMAATATEEAAR